MSRTDRSKDRFKQPKLHKPASSKRQKYRDEIEEELIEWETDTQTYGKDMPQTSTTEIIMPPVGRGILHDS